MYQCWVCPHLLSRRKVDRWRGSSGLGELMVKGVGNHCDEVHKEDPGIMSLQRTSTSFQPGSRATINFLESSWSSTSGTGDKNPLPRSSVQAGGGGTGVKGVFRGW